MSIKVTGFKSLYTTLDKIEKAIAEAGIKAPHEIGLDHMNNSANSIHRDVYGRTPSPHYTRTGRAQQGRRLGKVGRLGVSVTESALLVRTPNKPNDFGYTPPNPKKNYSVFLNRRTGYYDQALKKTIDNAGKNVRRLIKEELKNI